MVINTNIQAQINSDNLQATQARLNKSLARLSSGSKIIAPSDDAAGLAVASRMDAQIGRTNAAKKNVASAISFTQTQDGYLGKISKALNRMSELSILAQDATKSDSDRTLYNKEFSELQNYIATDVSAEFNGVSLFSSSPLTVTIDSDGGSFNMAGINLAQAPYSLVSDPTAKSSMQLSSLSITGGTIQLGASGPTIAISANDTLQQVFDRMHAADSNVTASLNEATGLVTVTNASGAAIALSETGTDFFEKSNLSAGGSLNLVANGYAASTSSLTPAGTGISTVAAAIDSLAKVKLAISQLASDRATIGAYQTRLNYVTDQLTVGRQNLSAASSQIQDVDVADESTEYARENVLQQSGTAMLAQANQLPQSVLKLLQ
jgi:flagellin